MASASLRALLSGLIDYAGLFPPAGLPLADVVRNYISYRGSSDSWALGRLVVPAARLGELLPLMTPSGDPWPVTALVGDDVPGDAARIAELKDTASLAVQSAEVRAATVQQVRTVVGALWSVPEVYVELPLTESLPILVKAVADAGARAKIRTGGVVAEAIPSRSACARFIEACVAHGVAFKATAGLHHPLRGRYPLIYGPDAPRGEMFGFLNVFVAAVFARGGMCGKELEAVLAEASLRAFEFSDTGVVWRGQSLTLDDVQSTRKTFAMTFGSCSFREPIDDLTQFGLLSS
jgi:hypothetical protein